MSRPFAIFDLDGTLIDRNSFFYFFWTFSFRTRTFSPLLLAPFGLAIYVCRLVSSQTAKERILRLFIGNRMETEVAEHARWFARNWIPKHLRPKVFARLLAHQARGDLTVLLSASPEIYVKEIANSLKFDECISTRVARSGGRWLGNIEGENCKGAAKVRALKAQLGQEIPIPSWAYGDSESDLEILRSVTNGFKIDFFGRLRALRITG
jgi:phosphatidylglycerophosphatase C